MIYSFLLLSVSLDLFIYCLWLVLWGCQLWLWDMYNIIWQGERESNKQWNWLNNNKIYSLSLRPINSLYRKWISDQNTKINTNVNRLIKNIIFNMRDVGAEISVWVWISCFASSFLLVEKDKQTVETTVSFICGSLFD